MRTLPDITLYQGSERTQLPFARPFNPLLGALPGCCIYEKVLTLKPDGSPISIRAAIEESESKRLGGESILSRLSKLMFVEVVQGVGVLRLLVASKHGCIRCRPDKMGPMRATLTAPIKMRDNIRGSSLHSRKNANVVSAST